MNTLTSFRFRSCSDPRDKIFGLMGLLEPGFRRLVHPHYDRPPEDLYIDVVLAFARNTGSLDILSCKHGSKPMELDFPSFVLDWTTQVIGAVHRASDQRVRYTLKSYYASQDSLPDLRKTDPGEINTSGMYVDQTMSIAPGERSWNALMRAWRGLARTRQKVCPTLYCSAEAKCPTLSSQSILL